VFPFKPSALVYALHNLHNAAEILEVINLITRVLMGLVVN